MDLDQLVEAWLVDQVGHHALCLRLVKLSILPILDPLRCLYSLYSYKMHNRYSPDMEVPSPSFGRSNQSVIQKRFVHFPSMRFNISWAVAFVSK